MNENESDLLCGHMSHSARVPKDYYRLPSRKLDLAEMSKLHLAAENSMVTILDSVVKTLSR